MNHTPGPWQWFEISGEDDILPHLGIGTVDEQDGSYSQEVATIVNRTGNFTDEQVFNARLIAAAPAMLAALKEISTLSDEWQGENPYKVLARIEELANRALEVQDATSAS